MIFLKILFIIFLFQFFFVSLQPNLDLSSIWGWSESHRSRDVKPWLPYLLGARKQKTVPSVEQAGANPARHIVAKVKEGLPSYAESNESVYWRLWFDVLKPEKFHSIFRAQDISRCSWVYHTLMRTLFLRCACVCYTRVGFCMFFEWMGFLRTSKHG